MSRRVVIYPDQHGLFALRCVEPCSAVGWCMDMAPDNAGEWGSRVPAVPGCYLGAASSPDLAARMAERWGYSVAVADFNTSASSRSIAAISE
jgi:hypothetical protein